MWYWQCVDLGPAKGITGTDYVIIAKNAAGHNYTRSLRHCPDLITDDEMVWHIRGAIKSIIKEIQRARA